MASSSSVSVPPMMQGEDQSNWAELPQELMSSILLRLSMVEILISSQKVCRSWRRVCKDPSMWQKIDMRDLQAVDLRKMCRQVVDLSQGGLQEINLSDIGSDELLTYIADRSSNLRSLSLQLCYPLTTNKGLVNAIAKLPMLETLEISHTWLKLNLKNIGQACPQLRTLKLTSHLPTRIMYDDDYALAIAESMPQLRHLQLIRDRISEHGLNAILDNLPYLKHLDLRKCIDIKLVGNLEKRCLERVKELRRPDLSTADCPFDILFFNSDSDDDLELKYLVNHDFWW